MGFFSTNDRSSARTSKRSGIVFLLLILIGFGIGASAFRVLGISSNNATVLPTADKTKTTPNLPHLVRNGQRITIPEGSPLRDKLTVGAVGNKEIQRSLVLPGVVEVDPARTIKVLPPLAGRITQLKVQLGQRIESGQALAVLDSADLGTAYADYDRAHVMLSLALRNRDRQRELAKIGGAEKDQLQAEADYSATEAEFVRANARLRHMGASPAIKDKSRVLVISSPISGSVVDLGVAPGAVWNDPMAALMTIADLSTVWVTANVSEKDTHLIIKDQPVDIVFPAYPGEVFKGKVLFISDVLDADTRRTKVRIAFPNPGARLKPGMFATVTAFAPKLTVAVVPTTALVLKNDASQVFVEVEPWIFEPSPVEIGFQQGDYAIVENGLKAGDRVVVKGGVLLSD